MKRNGRIDFLHGERNPSHRIRRYVTLCLIGCASFIAGVSHSGATLEGIRRHAKGPVRRAIPAHSIAHLPATVLLSPPVSINPFTRLANGITRNLENLSRSAQIDQTQSRLDLTFSSDPFFIVGSAKIKNTARIELLHLASLVRANVPDAPIEIAAHTDSQPVLRHRHLYPSNWELSSARAAAVVHLFEMAGFAKERLKIVGYADSRPATKVGMRPRRMVVRIGGGP